MSERMTEISLQRRLVLALDTPDVQVAEDLVRRTKSSVGTYKVGLQLFIAAGPSFLKWLHRMEVDIFLDLKLHDIPNTVTGAVQSAASHGVSLLTVHGLGGPAMLKAAKDALSGQTTLPGVAVTRLLAVTVLTHHTGLEMQALGLEQDPATSVERLLGLSLDAGMDGCVCSPEEAKAVREIVGPDFLLVCPGIRPKGSPLGDQARTATPYEAVRDGADYLVVGRPIRTAPDPAQAAADILVEIERGLNERAGG